MSDNLPAVATAEDPADQAWRIGLTLKMQAFVEHYAEYRNATQAWTAAYDSINCSYGVRSSEGGKLLRDPRIQEAIRARHKVTAEQTSASVAWLLERFVKIATADPRELIGLKVGCCRYCHGADHQYQWREREYNEAMQNAEYAARDNPNVRYPDVGGGFGFNATYAPHPDCPQCHGEGLERFVPRDTDKLSDQALLLYGGVKVKKDGYEIIIADQSKAAELAGRIMGAFNDKVKISGAVGHLVAAVDLRSMDAQDAARAYREFVTQHL